MTAVAERLRTFVPTLVAILTFAAVICGCVISLVHLGLAQTRFLVSPDAGILDPSTWAYLGAFALIVLPLGLHSALEREAQRPGAIAVVSACLGLLAAAVAWFYYFGITGMGIRDDNRYMIVAAACAFVAALCPIAAALVGGLVAHRTRGRSRPRRIIMTVLGSGMLLVVAVAVISLSRLVITMADLSRVALAGA